jgi:Icc-related predicted phosphoesterase
MGLEEGRNKMKIHVLSDLHLEFSNYQPSDEADQADVIVLAGDIWIKDHGVYWARATWPDHEIVYVAGNHEFYNADRGNVISRLKEAAQETGVRFLENDEVVIGGVRFLGCTLWTDFELYGIEQKRMAMAAVGIALNDFRLISDNGAPFTTLGSLSLHQASREWLRDRLKQPFDGDTVVVTHHAPSWNSVLPRFAEDIVSAGFASRLEDLMGAAKIWIHGHMHDSLDYEVGGTRVICNPRGYALNGQPSENQKFNPLFLLQL